MIPIRIGHRFTLPLDWYIRRRVERRIKITMEKEDEEEEEDSLYARGRDVSHIIDP